MTGTSARTARAALTIVAALLPAPVGARQVNAPEPAHITFGETFTIESRALSETRRINVYLPAAYDAATRLPVLYMPDGGMMEDFLHIAGLVQVSTGNGTMRPFILVGIENTARRRDLTGPTTVASDREVAPVVGGSAAFRDFIRTELFPLIEARYRTTDERAIIGESLAGLFIVETYFLEPDLFDTYIAFDPSLWWNGGRLVEQAASRMPATAGRTLFVANSSEPGIVPFVHRLADMFEQHPPAGTRFIHEDMPAETHATIYHPAALRALRLLLGPGS